MKNEQRSREREKFYVDKFASRVDRGETTLTTFFNELNCFQVVASRKEEEEEEEEKSEEEKSITV